MATSMATAASGYTWGAPRTTPILNDPACWKGPDMAAKKQVWTVDLTEQHVAEIHAAVAELEARGLKMEDIRRADFQLPTLGPVLAEKCAKEVEFGRGFALLRGLPVHNWSDSVARSALWGLGAHVGTAEIQDAAGLLMHDVKDIAPKADGQTLEERMAKDSTIRGFQTNAALPFHTDGSDALVMACLQKGQAGGQSLLISAPSVFNTIVSKRPDLAAVLQEAYHFDARGQRADGARCQVHPIFTIHAGRVNVLQKEPYIHSAQRFEDVPRLTAAQKEALDLMRDVMDSDDLKLRFTLEPGDVVFCSNHSVLHGREAFDANDAAKAAAAAASVPTQIEGIVRGRSLRHMLRLWVTLHSGRQLPPHYGDTREYCYTYSRRGWRSGLRVFDGSMGRLLLNTGLPSDSQLWSARALVEEQYHQMVVDAHFKYIQAGADAITTNNYAVQPCYYRKAFDADQWSKLLVEHTKLAGKLARQARDKSGRYNVTILGCLPPLVESHRPDLTLDAYKEDGEEFYAGVYKQIAEALVHDADCFLAETLSTEKEMLCAVRAASAVRKPVIVAMAAALRDRELKEQPSRAAGIVELLLQEVEEGRADVPVLCFNCSTPEICTKAVEAIPENLRQRMRNANMALGIYANLNADASKRQASGLDFTKKATGDDGPVRKIARREDATDDFLVSFCEKWTAMGVSFIGGCCGSTPSDIKVISSCLQQVQSTDDCMMGA